MRKRSIPTGAMGLALSLLAAGSLTAASTPAAAAQNVVTTQSYTVGNGPVVGATAVAQPNTAGATANYAIGFTTPSALAAGSSTLTLSDPTASTTFPGGKTNYFIIDNTKSSSGQPVSAATLGADGHSVTVSLSAAVAAHDSLTVYVLGATNPSTPGPYILDVSTSANPAPASTAAYQIVSAAAAPAFNPAATPPTVGASSTYTIGAFKAASAVSVGGGITVSSFAPSGTSDDVGFPTSTSAYKVTDLTTGASAAPSAVTISGVGSGDTGESVNLLLSSAVAAGDELSVTIAGAHNPTSTQNDTVTASAPSTTSPVAASLLVGTSVTSPTISLSQATAGAGGVEYTVGFKTSSALGAGGTVSLVAPAGTSFSGAAVTIVDTTHTTASASVPAASVKTVAGPSSSSQNQLTVTVPNAISAGDHVFVEVIGATNPPAGNYGGPAGDFTVATSSDVIPATAPAYAVTAAPAPTLASIQLSSATPGSVARYTVGDLKASAALVAGSATIELNAPAGTVFLGTPADFTIADLTHAGATTHPSTVSGAGTDDVVLRVAANIASGDFVQVVADDVVNPPAATYQLSVVGDLVAAVPPTPPPPPSTKTTTTTLSSSANAVVTGETVTYTAKVTPTPGGGSVTFTDNGAVASGCGAQPVSQGRAICSVTYLSAGRHSLRASYSGNSGYLPSQASPLTEVVNLPPAGYWLATGMGTVFGAGGAPSLGGVSVTGSTGPIVGIAGSPTGKGYWLVTANGTVAAFGDAHSYGDLPGSHVSASDITAIAPTADGHGYWLVGRDGGLFAFGDAKFHGSVPGLGFHVHDIVGMVASPDGRGYLAVGDDGGVFTFGSAHFYGSVPGLKKHVTDIRAILPSSTGRGYVLVGADGGAFVFGTGVHFLGSLPGRGIKVADIVGIALSPDNGGYYMAGANGDVYGFGDAVPAPMPAGLSGQLPVVAVAGT